MHCTNCGAQLPDGSVFCTNCGAQMGEEEAKTFCTNCGSTVSASAVICPTCGQALTAAPAPKKSIDLKNLDIKKLLIPGAIAIAGILVVVLLISLLGGSTAPLDGLENTVNNGNFTVIVEFDDYDCEIKVDLDLKKKELTAYGEIEYLDYYDDKVTMELGIYDEKLYIYYGEDDYRNNVTDIGDQLDAFFDAYEDGEDVKWDDIIEGIEDTADIDIDDKQFEKCVKDFEKKLENKKWLEENAGYSVKSKDGVKYHTYKPDLYKLLSASLDCFAKAFEDEDDFDDLMDNLKDVKSDLKAVEIKLKLGVKGKNLVSAVIELGDDKYEATIEDIGSTKINTNRLEDRLDEID